MTVVVMVIGRIQNPNVKEEGGWMDGCPKQCGIDH